MEVKQFLWIIPCIIYSYGQEAAIVSTNSSLYALNGQTLNLTCKINKRNAVAIYFLRNGKPISPDLFVNEGNACYPPITFICDHGQQLFTYSLQADSIENEDKWGCRADANGAPSTNVTIVVVVPFSLTMTFPIENKTTIDVNKVGVFHCETSLSRPEANILWFKRSILGTVSKLSDGFVTDVMQNKSMSLTHSKLNYTASKRDIGARMFCQGFFSEISSDIPENSREIELNIRYPPDKEPKVNNSGNLTVVEGNTIRIQCSISGGNPIASLSWTCNKNNISGKDTYNETTFQSEISLTANSTYNGGSCICIASHPLSDIKQVKTILNIQYSPNKNVTIKSSHEEYINASSNLTLRCEVYGGNPVANATWTCNGLSIPSMNTDLPDRVVSTITFKVDKTDYGKTCTCAANHFLWKQTEEKNITLNVYFAPDTNLKIHGANNATIFYENEAIELSCTLSNGNPLPEIKFNCWALETGVISGNSTTVVSVISSTAKKIYNGKICKCTAEHILLQTILENSIQTIVYYPPMQPQLVFSPQQPLLEGQAVNVSCNAVEGNPQISYYNWTLNSIPVHITSKVFRFGKINREINQQTIQCRVNNAFTDFQHIKLESNSEPINVNYRPLIVLLNETLTTIEGMTVNTSCTATGNPVPNVQWFHGNSPIGTVYKEQSHLSLTDIDRNKQGIYYCKAKSISTPHGNLESNASVEIIVNYPPDVSVLVDGNNMSVHSSVRLLCYAAGQPATYTFRGWLHSFNGVNIRTTEILHSNGNGSYITLSNLSYQDIGTYSCSVDNGIHNRNGSLTQSNSTFIAVKGFPIKIPAVPNNPIFTAEGRGILTAKLDFFTFPNITDLKWYNLTTGNAISSTDDSTNFSKTSLKYKLYGNEVDITDFAYEALLTIHNFQPYHEGRYSLVVSNGHRITNFTFRTQISGPPESPMFLNVSDKTDSEIVLQLISGFNGGHSQSFHVIYHEINSNNLPKKQIFVDSKIQPQLLKIINLKASTIYTFSVYASNEKGNSTFNETVCCSIIEADTDATTDEPLEQQGTPIAGIAAGLGASVFVIIIVIGVVVFFRRHKQLFLKGKDANGRLNLTSHTNDEEGENGLHENILYESAGDDFGTKKVSSDTEYAMVQKRGNKFTANEDKNLQETGLYSEVNKKSKIKNTGDVYTNVSAAKQRKDKYEDREKTSHFGNEDVYENMSDKMKISSTKKMSETKKNKDGLQYAELVFNPSPNGSKFVIHGIEDRTIYASVDTTQKIDPLPDSDDEADEQSSSADKQDD